MAAFLISIMIHGHKDQSDYNENKAEDFIITHLHHHLSRIQL